MNVLYAAFSLYLQLYSCSYEMGKVQLERNCCILDSSLRMRLQANCFSQFLQLLWFSSKKVSFRSTQFLECERKQVLQIDTLLSSTKDTTAICVSMPCFPCLSNCLIKVSEYHNQLFVVFLCFAFFFKKKKMTTYTEDYSTACFINAVSGSSLQNILGFLVFYLLGEACLSKIEGIFTCLLCVQVNLDCKHSFIKK